MNNEEARQILSAYRPGGADAGDPYFEEALKQARRDPEMKQWFEAERRFDRVVAAELQAISVPSEGKAEVIAVGRTERKSRGIPLWANALAAAVVLAAGLFFAWLSFGARDTAGIPQRDGVGAFVEMAAAAMPFDYRGDSVAELIAWLDENGAPAPGPLPEKMLAAGAVGCRVFADEAGNRISLLCLVMNGEFVHLFVTDEGMNQFQKIPERTWEANAGWNAYSWTEEGRGYVVLSRAPRSELETWMQEA